MPVKKTSRAAQSREEERRVDQGHMGPHARKIFATLLGILLVYVIIWTATLIRNNLRSYQYIGRASQSERTILLTADAKIKVTPDVAVTTVGMINTAPTVAEAQQKNTEVMNALIERVKALGVESADIQTSNYSINPQYNYTEKDGRILLGYEVMQNVQIKIRDIQKANQVFAIAGEVGANNVGGLQFIVDDHDVYLAKARQEALQKIAQKAQALSTSLDLRLGDVISYSEYEGGSTPPQYKAFAEDIGGAQSAPSIEPGSTDIVLSVNVTYEVR